MMCLHSVLIDAHKSGKILTVPPFPEKRRYGIEPKPIESVSEARQIAIINAIPIEHQPIFWWLKYHYRRPSEAMALYKEDYDRERDCFIIRRSFSSKRLVQHTKTHKIHTIPRHPEFRRIDPKDFSPYYFTHETDRLDQGGSIDELQMLTDHARRDSVLKYADVKLEAKRNIQAKILKIGAHRAHGKSAKGND